MSGQKPKMSFPFSPGFISTLQKSQQQPEQNSKLKKRKKHKRNDDASVTSEGSAPIVSPLTQSTITPSQTSVITSYAPKPEESLPHDRYFINNSNISEKRTLLRIQCDSIKDTLHLHISGIVNLTILRGKANVNGYQMKLNKSIRLSSSTWQPAFRLFCKPSNDSIDNSIKNEFNTMKDTKNSIIFLIESYSWEELDWIETAENYSKYSVTSLSSLPKNIFAYSLISGMICETYALRLLEIEPYHLPPTWVTACDQIIASRNKPMIIPICGAKGSGKSTCMKYLINRLLKYYNRVFVLNCDIGQPEFTVPGMVSLNCITAPVLQAAHHNVHEQTSELSYYIGDFSIKNNFDLYVQLIQKLYDRYETLLREHHEQYMQRYSNSFQSICDLDDDDHHDFHLPLIINCDGNIRFSGNEMLGTIFSLVKPSHVIHLVTPKDQNIPAIDALDTSMTIIHRIMPGNLQHSKIIPNDFRTLRYAAYFLRSNDALKLKTRPFEEKLYDTTAEYLTISNAAISDFKGCIAIELMKLFPYDFKFNELSFFSINAEEIVPRLTLALFNASLVGITVIEPAANDEEAVQLTRLSHNGKEFNLNCTTPFRLTPCVGVGIVRAVDMENHKLYVVSPCELNKVMPLASTIGLVRGTITPPSLFTFSSGLPSFPYLTGEAFGEGSSVIRPRTNMKRRSHQAT